MTRKEIFFMARFSASRSSDISARETRNMERSRKIASQGMVLLKNNGALPIVETGKRIAWSRGWRPPALP